MSSSNSALQTIGDSVGELVALLFELLKQDLVRFAARTESFGGQECGDVVEGVFLFAAERIVEIKREVTSLGEGVAVQEQDLTAGEEQDPTRIVFVGEEATDAAGPVALTESVLCLVFWGWCLGQGIFGGVAFFEAGVRDQKMGFADDEPRTVVPVDSMHGRDVRVSAFDGVFKRLQVLISQGIQQLTVPTVDLVATGVSVLWQFFVEGLRFGFEVMLR